MADSNRPRPDSPPMAGSDPLGPHEEKVKEAEQMAALNNQFAQFIDKVHRLQRQNRVLETQLKVLLEQEPYAADIEGTVEELSGALRQQVDSLAQEHEMLETRLASSERQVEENRAKYEDEILRKADAEQDFVLLKKAVDDAHLREVDLQLELEDTKGELDFLTRAFEEEIREFRSRVQSSRVFLQERQAQTFDMSRIVREVQTQYEKMAARSREEAEAWHRTQATNLAAKLQKHEQELKENQREVADTLQVVKKFFKETEALKRQREVLRTAVRESEDRGQQLSEEARERVRQLEEALLQAKQDVMQQVHDYEDVMNLTMALDMEIATYRKLLEGEESRLGKHGPRR